MSEKKDLKTGGAAGYHDSAVALSGGLGALAPKRRRLELKETINFIRDLQQHPRLGNRFGQLILQWLKPNEIVQIAKVSKEMQPVVVRFFQLKCEFVLSRFNALTDAKLLQEMANLKTLEIVRLTDWKGFTLQDE